MKKGGVKIQNNTMDAEMYILLVLTSIIMFLLIIIFRLKT